MKLSELQSIYQTNQGRFIERWKELLRIPSVSANPANDGDCRKAAEWLKKYFAELGFKSTVLETSGKPAVFAEYVVDGAPTALFYGHYDVQPPDPLDLWRSPPFEPEIREGRLYARGANDDKGQVSFVLAAIETVVKAKALRYSLKVFIEGEEETASRGIREKIPEWKEMLRADALLICDTPWLGSKLPTIVMGLKGIVGFTVNLTGPARDLHSGFAGAFVRNPATELSRLLATLHKPDGSIAVKGYYDDVLPIPDQIGAALKRSPVDLELLSQSIGTPLCGGETAYSALERFGFRPTIDINGVSSGYSGPGSKTVLPAKAMAKITSRIVPNQNPRRCIDQMIQHLTEHTPEGIEIEITEIEEGGAGFVLDPSHLFVVSATKVLEATSGFSVAYSWQGASIPIIPLLQEASGAYPLLVGFGLEEDNLHAPNESFSLEQFERGFLFVSSFLSQE